MADALSLILPLVLIAAGTLWLVIEGTRRIWSDRSRARGWGGVGNGLAEVNEMLQPQHPTAEILQQAKEGETEREQDGDPPDPQRSDGPRGGTPSLG